MSRIFSIALLLLLPLFLAACGGDDVEEPASGQHVWKEQTDTLKQAEQAAADLNESLQLKQQQLQDRSE